MVESIMVYRREPDVWREIYYFVVVHEFTPEIHQVFLSVCFVYK